MRIQHNIMAMNAYRNYNNNTSALSKNLEKLSSGYKINRAGDDAAGLAISEKMRAQITGLNAAQKNVKDGISLVKTGEGAMQEIQDMLNRMDYLATQSANGTYDNEVDRANLQKEVSALKEEINRIADSANFNGINLLDGSMEKRAATAASLVGVKASGMDRIISSVIGEGEKPNLVAGKKTVLDTAVQETAVKAKFDIDLKGLKFNNTMGAEKVMASGSVAGSNMILTIGDVTISTANASSTALQSLRFAYDKNGVVTSNASVKATMYAAALYSAILGKQTTAYIDINGVKWQASVSGSKLTFTQVNDPQTAEEARANFDVKVALADDAEKGQTKIGGSIDPGTHVVTEGVAKDSAHKANTIFKITEEDIWDGAKITIGTKTVTLAVGVNTAYAGATNAVNLSFMESGKIDLNRALSAISKTFGSEVGVKYTSNITGSSKTATFQVGVSDGANGFPTGLTVQRVDKNTATIGTSTVFDAAFLELEDLASVFNMTYAKEIAGKSAQSGLTLQIGDTSEKFNQMTVSIGDMHTSALGIDGIDISNQEGAAKAVQTIKDAINYVSGVRGDLGAIQNRLEHTQNNLSVMAENIQDAESTIRDTDVAEEMMSYVKNNILIQSAQAMLAQANQVPQGVLQLLG